MGRDSTWPIPRKICPTSLWSKLPEWSASTRSQIACTQPCNCKSSAQEKQEHHRTVCSRFSKPLMATCSRFSSSSGSFAGLGFSVMDWNSVSNWFRALAFCFRHLQSGPVGSACCHWNLHSGRRAGPSGRHDGSTPLLKRGEEMWIKRGF